MYLPIEHGDFLMFVFGGVTGNLPVNDNFQQPVASVVPVVGAIAILAKFCMVMAIMFNLLAERSHRFTPKEHPFFWDAPKSTPHTVHEYVCPV